MDGVVSSSSGRRALHASSSSCAMHALAPHDVLTVVQAPGLVRRCCYESRRESKVTRRGYANSGRTRQWHHHRACGGRVNVRRLLPLPLLLLMRYGIHPPEPAQHMRRRHRTCVHRRGVALRICIAKNPRIVKTTFCPPQATKILGSHCRAFRTFQCPFSVPVF